MNRELYIPENLESRLIYHASFLNANPEVGFELNKTSEYVFNELKKMGLSPKRCGKSGISASIELGSQGKTFLLRADMDALLCSDEVGETKAMHLCGHHMHTSMLLGAAEILANQKENFNGSVKLMFQPAEEILEGAKDMISNGILSDPIPDGAMMIHVMSGVDIPIGNVIVSTQEICAPAADFFNIEIIGKGTHGALSHLGIDPINVSAHIVTAFYELIAQECIFGEPSRITIGKISAGESDNVIPDKALIFGTLRTFNEYERKKIKERVVEIVENIAKAFNADAHIKFTRSCPTLKNDLSISSLALESLRMAFGNDKVFASEEKSSMRGGSEDFAYVSQKIPSVIVSVAAGSKAYGYEYPLHNPAVLFDNRALIIGAIAYSRVAIDFLQK